MAGGKNRVGRHMGDIIEWRRPGPEPGRHGSAAIASAGTADWMSPFSLFRHAVAFWAALYLAPFGLRVERIEDE